MASKYYQYEKEGNKTDIYVLELEGSLKEERDLAELERNKSEILKNGDMNGLIIYQKTGNLLIHSHGIGKIVVMCAELSKKGIEIKFSNLRGSLDRLFSSLTQNIKCTNYNSLEEAIDSYKTTPHSH